MTAAFAAEAHLDGERLVIRQRWRYGFGGRVRPEATGEDVVMPADANEGNVVGVARERRPVAATATVGPVFRSPRSSSGSLPAARVCRSRRSW